MLNEIFTLAQAVARMDVEYERCRLATGALLTEGHTMWSVSALTHWLDHLAPLLAHGRLVLAAVLAEGQALPVVPAERAQCRPPSSPRRAPNALPQLTLEVFRLRGLELSVDAVFHAVRASMPEVTPARLRVCLSDLKKAGHLRSVGRGRYTLAAPLPHLSVVGT